MPNAKVANKADKNLKKRPPKGLRIAFGSNWISRVSKMQNLGGSKKTAPGNSILNKTPLKNSYLEKGPESQSGGGAGKKNAAKANPEYSRPGKKNENNKAGYKQSLDSTKKYEQNLMDYNYGP